MPFICLPDIRHSFSIVASIASFGQCGLTNIFWWFFVVTISSFRNCSMSSRLLEHCFKVIFLTLMLLVANLANTKWCKKTAKLLKPWHMGTHLRELVESFPMDTNMTAFRWFSKTSASLCFERKLNLFDIILHVYTVPRRSRTKMHTIASVLPLLS